MGCEWVVGVCGCFGMWEWALVCAGVCGSVQVYAGVHGCAEVWVGVWDEFSEYLLETRVLTSADFNMYPI